MADENPTPESTETTEAPAAQPATGELGDAGKKAIDAMKAERDAAIKERKALDKALEQERTKNLSDAERAIAEAKAAARSETLTEVGTRLARSEIRAAAAAAGVDLTADLEYLNLARFVTDDGEPDDKAITAYVTSRAAAQAPQVPAVPSFDGGARTTPQPVGGMNRIIRSAAGRAS